MGVRRLKRHPITTADERSWIADRPVLFLGEWVLLYDRKNVWSAMDAIVAAPYGIEGRQRERDIVYVKTVAGELLAELVSALNTFHGTEPWSALLADRVGPLADSLCVGRVQSLHDAGAGVQAIRDFWHHNPRRARIQPGHPRLRFIRVGV